MESKGVLREKSLNYDWREDETIDVRKSISVVEYKVERLSVLDKKLVSYVNKFGYENLKRKILTKYVSMTYMYSKMDVHESIVAYIENMK